MMNPTPPLDSHFGSMDRITHVPGVMGGRATIRGMRVTAGMIVSQIACGTTPDELLAAFPYIEREDITQAMSYAAWLASEEFIYEEADLFDEGVDLTPPSTP